MSMIKRYLENQIYEIAERYDIPDYLAEAAWERSDGDIEVYEQKIVQVRKILDRAMSSHKDY